MKVSVSVRGFLRTQLKGRIKSVKATIAKKQKKLMQMESEFAKLNRKVKK